MVAADEHPAGQGFVGADLVRLQVEPAALRAAAHDHGARSGLNELVGALRGAMDHQSALAGRADRHVAAVHEGESAERGHLGGGVLGNEGADALGQVSVVGHGPHLGRWLARCQAVRHAAWVGGATPVEAPRLSDQYQDSVTKPASPSLMEGLALSDQVSGVTDTVLPPPATEPEAT